MVPLQLVVASLIGWLQSGQCEIIEDLREENRVLKAQLRSQRVRLTAVERRRLAVLGARLGRRILAQVATIVTPETILRRHRQLIARKWTYAKRRFRRTVALAGRPRHAMTEILQRPPASGYSPSSDWRCHPHDEAANLREHEGARNDPLTSNPRAASIHEACS